MDARSSTAPDVPNSRVLLNLDGPISGVPFFAMPGPIVPGELLIISHIEKNYTFGAKNHAFEVIIFKNVLNYSLNGIMGRKTNEIKKA